MTDFQFGRNHKLIRKIPSITWTLAIFAGVVVVFILAVNSISAGTENRQEETLRQAIDRCIINCYCVEGTYPPSLQYIEDNYGLIYDENLFFIDYRAIGSNILPDVTIIRKEQ